MDAITHAINNMYGLTELESVVLTALVHDEFNAINGAHVTEGTNIDDLSTWAGVPEISGYERTSLRGAMGSLAAKGFFTSRGAGRDAELFFSEKAKDYAVAVDATR